uniref:Uncharacterized protein n=1 Tax=Solanum lycopersicum TaxID=4081 RepID=A0A3Q7HWR8_SOLLC
MGSVLPTISSIQGEFSRGCCCLVTIIQTQKLEKHLNSIHEKRVFTTLRSQRSLVRSSAVRPAEGVSAMVSLGISDSWWILDILDRNDTEEERQVSFFDAVDDSSADSMNFGEEEDSSGVTSHKKVLKMINIQSLAMPSLSPAFFTSCESDLIVDSFWLHHEQRLALTRVFELIIFQRFGDRARPGNLLPGSELSSLTGSCHQILQHFSQSR